MIKEQSPTPPNAGEGWYEVINPRGATTNIAHVSENGDLYLPEGEAALSADEFAFAAARGDAHLLVRADGTGVEQPPPAAPSAPADPAERRDRYAAAMYATSEHAPVVPWDRVPPAFRRVWLRRADAAVAVADTEQAAAEDAVEEASLDLYRAQDTLAFVEERCVIADREGRPVTTADVRTWLKGPRCGRQLLAGDGTPAPADRAALSTHLWEITKAHITAEWICCQPLAPRHDLCAKGHAALGIAKTLLVDNPEAWNPAAPLLDAVMAALSAPADRAAVLREAADVVGNDDDCGCGGCDTCVPNALADELRRLADEAPRPEPSPVAPAAGLQRLAADRQPDCPPGIHAAGAPCTGEEQQAKGDS